MSNATDVHMHVPANLETTTDLGLGADGCEPWCRGCRMDRDDCSEELFYVSVTGDGPYRAQFGRSLRETMVIGVGRTVIADALGMNLHLDGKPAIGEEIDTDVVLTAWEARLLAETILARLAGRGMQVAR
jgi:hypothetical protein